MTLPTEGEILKTCETEDGSISLSWRKCENRTDQNTLLAESASRLTATFFCDSTTAQFFPLTPIEVMLADVMALNAYSGVQVGRSAVMVMAHRGGIGSGLEERGGITYRLGTIDPGRRRW